MPAEKLRKINKILWWLPFGFTVMLLLITPKLGADLTGRLTTLALLVVCFGSFAVPMWLTNWFHRTKIRLILGLVGVALIMLAMGSWVWPYTLSVDPNPIQFDSSWANETYTVSITNRSDKTIYRPTMSLVADRLSNPREMLSMSEFSFDIPLAERKPMDQSKSGSSQNNVADVMGLLCLDPESHPGFWIWITQLGPHESRHITITHVERDKVTVQVKANSFWEDPLPLGIKWNADGSLDLDMAIRFGGGNGQLSCFRGFGFRYLDGEQPQGMFWLSLLNGDRTAPSAR